MIYVLGNLFWLGIWLLFRGFPSFCINALELKLLKQSKAKLCRIVRELVSGICPSVCFSENCYIIAITRQNTKSLVMTGLSQTSKVFLKLAKILCLHVFKPSTLNPTNLINPDRYNQPISDFVVLKQLLHVYKSTFCQQSTIVIVLCSCFLTCLLSSILSIRTFCLKTYTSSFQQAMTRK